MSQGEKSRLFTRVTEDKNQKTEQGQTAKKKLFEHVEPTSDLNDGIPRFTVFWGESP